MFKNFKKLVFFILLLSIGLLFASCDVQEPIEIPFISVDPLAGVQIFNDEQNLVEVQVIEGKATAFFNSERWMELYSLSDIYRGEMKITKVASNVDSVVVAQMEDLDFINNPDYVTPAIFMLMEDGTVEMAMALLYPEVAQSVDLVSVGSLPWLSNIVSLSYEKSTEGIGDYTVIAKDSNEVEYDLNRVGSYINLFSGVWSCELFVEDNKDYAGYYAVLDFSDDLSVKLELGWIYGYAPIVYNGEYLITIAENGDQRPGILYLDLYLESNGDYEQQQPMRRGWFFLDMQGMTSMQLFHSDGDTLYTVEGMSFESGLFANGYDPFNYLSVDDYTNHLVKYVPKAKEYIEMGMAVLVTHEYTLLEGQMCRDIWLGTNNSERFVREIHYAISDTGDVYQYDPVNNSWTFIVSEPIF